MLLASLLVAPLFAAVTGAAHAQDRMPPCTEDAMIVFDASGSMAGSLAEGIGTMKPRIDEVRQALRLVLPVATQYRKVGLITYGPGPYRQCNVELDFRPIPEAAEPIMTVVNGLIPAGKTPLTEAVERAAEVLDFRTKPGVVVVLTDGEETCDGAPCALGELLQEEGQSLTVHVIGFQLKTYIWMGNRTILDVMCLAEATGGLYITAESQEDLVKAFEKTLGCPMMSRLAEPRPEDRRSSP